MPASTRRSSPVSPEPNGYLHIGHAKSICLNFGLAQEFAGDCHLRFDDTNPAKEDQEYIDAIEADIKWLGFQWSGEVCYASNYFDQLHAWAIELIKAGKAFVCDLGPEEMREYRGTLTEPGRNSPYRDRSVEENLDLFARMKAGEFPDGARSLRAKIDMGSPNMNLRDPILYRIRHAHHHQTGDKWCIYPSYDFTHGQSDAIEGITHSICTLEFEDHRPLYEWFLANLPVPAQPRQYEFSRLNLNYTVTSKRKLKQLVDEGHVSGWDDPRMSTLSGYRRRGYTPESIRNFCEMIGVNRASGVVDIGMLEFSIRDHLDATAPRAMCVLKPLKVVITNYPEGQVENLELPRHPKEDMGVRVLPFGRELFIDAGDFEEVPPAGYKRLIPGGEVRLRGSYVIRADEAIKDADGNNRRTALQLRSGHPGQEPGRPQGQGRDPLGAGRGQRRVRSAPVRSAVPLGQSGEGGRGRQLPRQHQRRLPAGTGRLSRRAVAGPGEPGGSLPVRARRLFRRRPEGLQAGQAGVQPYRHPA